MWSMGQQNTGAIAIERRPLQDRPETLGMDRIMVVHTHHLQTVERFRDAPWGFYVFVTDGELQIQLEVGRDSIRKSLSQVTQERLRSVFAWTAEFGVPVLPLSAAEETAPQLRRLLGALPTGRHARGGGHSQTEASLG